LSLVLFCFLLLIPSPPNSTLFPYTTLFRSGKDDSMNASSGVRAGGSGLLVSLYRDLDLDDVADQEAPCLQSHIPVQAKVFAIDLDRKSTRLNSSHLGISYAVFCLKKKKEKK